MTVETFWPALVVAVSGSTTTARYQRAKVFLRDGEARAYTAPLNPTTGPVLAVSGMITARRGAGTTRQPLVLDMADGSTWTVARRGCACGAASALQSFRPEGWE